MTIANLHPRRAARQCVLEALFAYEFSKNDALSIVNQIINKNSQVKANQDFIQFLFECVLKNIKWSEDIINSHLENWEFVRSIFLMMYLLRIP